MAHDNWRRRWNTCHLFVWRLHDPGEWQWSSCPVAVTASGPRCSLFGSRFAGSSSSTLRQDGKVTGTLQHLQQWRQGSPYKYSGGTLIWLEQLVDSPLLFVLDESRGMEASVLRLEICKSQSSMCDQDSYVKSEGISCSAEDPLRQALNLGPTCPAQS